MRGERTLTQLEWFAVTYRSLVAWSTLGAVLLAAGGGYWFYRFRWAPRTAALTALAGAEEQLRQAQPLAEAELLRETVGRAAQVLEDARVAFDDGRYSDARFAALHSADLSAQALDRARGERSDSRLVRFYRLEGEVRVKHAGEFAWEAANANVVLNIGDQVKTASSASAQLIFFDGTVTTIQPGSLLEIRDLFEDPNTKVRRVRQKLSFGEVQAQTPERNVRGSFSELATDELTARTEHAGEMRVTYDRESRVTVVDAFRGEVEIAAGERRDSLAAGERVRADAQGRLQGKEALPGVPRLVSPPDQRVFLLERSEKTEIPLAWEPVAAAARYHLVISDKPLFTDPLYDAHREGASAQLEVGPGTYYWKTAAVNAAGAAGPFSDVRAFRVSAERIRDKSDTTPPHLEVTEFVTIGMMVILNGRSEPGATLWVDNEKVEVLDDGRFNTVVRLPKEGLNSLRLRAQDTAGNETTLNRSAYVEMY